MSLLLPVTLMDQFFAIFGRLVHTSTVYTDLGQNNSCFSENFLYGCGYRRNIRSFLNVVAHITTHNERQTYKNYLRRCAFWPRVHNLQLIVSSAWTNIESRWFSKCLQWKWLGSMYVSTYKRIWFYKSYSPCQQLPFSIPTTTTSPITHLLLSSSNCIHHFLSSFKYPFSNSLHYLWCSVEFNLHYISKGVQHWLVCRLVGRSVGWQTKSFVLSSREPWMWQWLLAWWW